VFLNLTLKLLLTPVDNVEVIVSEPAPLLLGSALELLPVPFDSIPIHGALPFVLFKLAQKLLSATTRDWRDSTATLLQRGALPLGHSFFQVARESWTSLADEPHDSGRSCPSR